MRLDKTLLAAIALSLTTSPSWAGFHQGNQVTMGGTPVFAIPAGAEGFSPEHRAWLAQDALDNALVVGADKGPNAVAVGRGCHAITVLLDGIPIATADAESARMEGLTPEGLAQKWAQGVRNFLADPARTAAYVAELTGRVPIAADIAFERRIFIAPGTVLPVTFDKELCADNLVAGQVVTGTVTTDIAFGNYIIPCGAKVTGVVNEEASCTYSISFNTLTMPNGSTVPIAAELTGSGLTAGAPHLVATEGMPSGERLIYQSAVETACRVPSEVGIGTFGGPMERLVFRKGSHVTIAANAPLSVMFPNVTSVAVVLRGSHM